MQLRNRQLGLGMWMWIFVLSVIGSVSLITMQLTPIYLAELGIQRVVGAAAKDPGNAKANIAKIRKAMKTRWDVEGITTLDVKDVRIVKHGPSGRALEYDYEATAPLFANLSILAEFHGYFPMDGVGPVDE